MTVKEYANKLGMKVLTGNSGASRDISGVYVGDLLSRVMAHAAKGEVWITIHTHLNIVAVALLTEVSCIIIPEQISIDVNTINKARQEDIAILSTEMSAYEVCWKTHEIIGN